MATKKILIEITEQEAEQLGELAREHGNKVKPFIEYLIRLQLGAVSPPTVQPVKIPVQDLPAENTTAHIRKGEVIEAHKEGMFLQYKRHPKGITSNGECFRIAVNGEFIYAYFAEDLTKHITDDDLV